VTRSREEPLALTRLPPIVNDVLSGEAQGDAIESAYHIFSRQRCDCDAVQDAGGGPFRVGLRRGPGTSAGNGRGRSRWPLVPLQETWPSWQPSFSFTQGCQVSRTSANTWQPQKPRQINEVSRKAEKTATGHVVCWQPSKNRRVRASIQVAAHLSAVPVIDGDHGDHPTGGARRPCRHPIPPPPVTDRRSTRPSAMR
jgi:hypothetical protein